MINASQEFKNLIRKGVKLVNYADIILKDGTVLNLGPSDFSVGGFSINDKTADTNFSVGSAIAKTITSNIANHTDKFSKYDFYMAKIYMYVAIEKEDGTVLKEKKGKYYVTSPITPGDIIQISGVDSMYLFDKPYNASTAFPATLQTILSDCCIDCGVNIGFGEFENWDFVVLHKPTDCTYRQVVSWVAQIAGYNARINNNDYLELVWYDSSLLIDGGNYFLYDNEDVLDGGDFTTYDDENIIDGGNFTDDSNGYITRINNLSVSTDDVIITGVKVEYEETYYIYGSEDYIIHVKDNPLTEEKEQEIANYLGKRLIGLYFRPLTCTIPNSPLYEPFDTCYVCDRKGNEYLFLINNVNYTINGFTTLSCKAEDPVRNESSYESESAKAVAQAKRNTEKQITTYDKAVQNMNALASNAMGLYRESETQSDGSVIYYMSNRPIVKNDNSICEFELNSVVYKMTGDGFFVSEDGGLSYTSGFDSEGNAVVNVLSAIGITFDWARGGTLTLGGINDTQGKLIVLNNDGESLGEWNAEGFWAKSKDYSKPETTYAQSAYATCGSTKRKVQIMIVGAIGADSDDVYKEGSYFTSTSEITFELYDPDGYMEDGCPYWLLSGKFIFGHVNMAHNITNTGYVKRIVCTYKTTKRTIKLYDEDFSTSEPVNGLLVDIRNNYIENSTWKIENDTIYKNRKLKGQSVLINSSMDTSGFLVASEDDLIEYSQLMLLSENNSNGNIASVTSFPTSLLVETTSGGWIQSDNTNYAAIKMVDGESEEDSRSVYLKTSNASYTAKLYGII